MVTAEFLLLSAPHRATPARAVAEALPHTFQVEVHNDAGRPIQKRLVANLPPDTVGMDVYGRLVGMWRLPPQRWRATPVWMRRTSYETVTVAFQPEGDGALTPAALARIPHTFSVAVPGGGGVVASMKDAAPHQVRTVRGVGVSQCPCYGLWHVPAPLAPDQPRWADAPRDELEEVGLSALAWARWTSGVRVVEFEYFYPSGAEHPTAAAERARTTPHTFRYAGLSVESRAPDDVYVEAGVRVVGRWRLLPPTRAVEPLVVTLRLDDGDGKNAAYGFDVNGTGIYTTRVWALLFAAILLVAWLYRRNQRPN